MKRSKFSLSHYHLSSLDMGQLIPLTWFEALPGDSIQHSTSLLLRVSPLLSPVMHPVRVRIHHWFVPNRLIWEDFEDFITGGPDGTFEAAVPKMVGVNVTEGSLYDYMGIPPYDYSTNSMGFSALPFRAFNLIFNEHYRDQDLVTERVVSTASGEDTTTDVTIPNVAWEKDYFTTARPWAQKGDEVTIPLGEKAPISGFGKKDQTYGQSNQSIYESNGEQVVYPTSDDSNAHAIRQSTQYPGYPDIYADLSQATGISVNDLREALAIQRYQEARAQYGSRYVEYLRYLGVRPSDARLQNPEYLGGGRNIIQFSEVLQTQRTDADQTPLGHMGGHGISAMRTNRYRRFFEEHGIVMTLASIVPKAIYMQSVPKKWSRLTKECYFQKELQFLGDQVVENKEIYAPHATPNGVFGYQNQYDDYRYFPSYVSAEMRNLLNYWHYARDFESEPALNSSFVTAVPTKRTNAEQTTNVLYCMANHSIQARRMVRKNVMPRTF